jgi:hypothetical protein
MVLPFEVEVFMVRPEGISLEGVLPAEALGVPMEGMDILNNP